MNEGRNFRCVYVMNSASGASNCMCIVYVCEWIVAAHPIEWDFFVMFACLLFVGESTWPSEDHASSVNIHV